MRSHPIWNEVTACIYKGGDNGAKNWGARDDCEVTVKVGTSRKNSEFLVQHTVTRRIAGDYTVFRFGVCLEEGGELQLLKTLWMHTKTHRWVKEPEADNRKGLPQTFAVGGEV